MNFFENFLNYNVAFSRRGCLIRYMKTNSHKRLKTEVADLLYRNKARILMICRAYAITPDDLEDCFQEVAIRIWEGYPLFRHDSAESTWIYRVTLNSAINFSRRKARRRLEVPLLDRDVIEEITIDPRTERLYELIDQLNPFEKALVLLWLENLPYAEIALIMGLTVKNVSVMLVRVKEKLKKLASTPE